MNFPKTADTDGFAEIDVTGDGSGAYVEPIDGLRGKFLSRARLDGVDPT